MSTAVHRTDAEHTITLRGRRVRYALRRSPSAKQCRVRVGPTGARLILPDAESEAHGRAFLRENGDWVLDQLDRIQILGRIRRTAKPDFRLRGASLRIAIAKDPHRLGANAITREGDTLRIVVGSRGANPAKTLERWLRAQARADFLSACSRICPLVHRRAKKILVMGQRTKWGNCSARGNISLNWRLVMAPPFVLDYVVAHELLHLAIPDHSDRFWLTLRSIFPQTNSARKWLTDNWERLMAWQL